MPVKNTAAYLPECLDSILNQSEQNWELIAINDHSTDNTKAILETYSKKESRIQIFDNQGEGIIEALQLAYQKSKGIYITRMDSDDIMMPHKLSELKNQLSQKGYLATGLVEYFSKEGIGDGYRKYQDWLNNLALSNTNFKEIYKECVIPSPCWMVHKSDFERCGGFDSDIYPEDYDLCFRFYESGLKVKSSKKVLHCWRDYNTRTSRTDEHYADNRFLALKLTYFNKLERKKEQPLILWGAGRKGKYIAKWLIEKEIPFHWICNNSKKIGKHIYNQLLEAPSFKKTLKQPQIIIAVAGAETQAILLKDLLNDEYYLFC